MVWRKIVRRKDKVEVEGTVVGREDGGKRREGGEEFGWKELR